MSIFRWLDSHMLLENLAEIPRVLIAAGSGNRIDLLVTLAQQLSGAAQTTLRQIGTE